MQPTTRKPGELSAAECRRAEAPGSPQSHHNGARRRAALAAGAVICALALLACGSDSDSQDSSKSKDSKSAVAEKTIKDLPAKQIIARVEKLRGKRFEQPPVAEAVSKEESAQHGKEQATSQSPREQLAIEEQLKLLGLVSKDTDLGEIGTSFGGDAALGFYESPPPRIALVAGKQIEDPENAEGVFAHELTHAIDDQYFGIFKRLKKFKGESDERAAFSALVEGDATALELAYRKQFTKGKVTEQDSGSLKGLPFALQLSLQVTYGGGAEFIADLVKDGGPRAIDRAFKDPPTSTSEILHPKQYLAGFKPTPVKLDVGQVLDKDWTRVADDSFGELDVLSLLAFSEKQVKPADPAAEGWRGGRIEFWRQGSLDPEQCPSPCVDRDVLVIGLDWKSPKDAAEFERAFATSLKRNRGAKSGSGDTFEVAGGGVAVRSSGAKTTIAYAPSSQQAATLSKRSR